MNIIWKRNIFLSRMDAVDKILFSSGFMIDLQINEIEKVLGKTLKFL